MFICVNMRICVCMHSCKPSQTCMYMHILRIWMHACAYIYSQMHIFTHTCVFVCDQASSHDGGGGCVGVRPAADAVAVASIEVDFVSPLCTPLCRLPPSAYVCRFTHMHLCVCMCVCLFIHTHTCVYTHACVYLDTHTHADGRQRHRVVHSELSKRERECVCNHTRTHTFVCA